MGAAALAAACPLALLARVTATRVPAAPVPLPLRGSRTRRNGTLCPVMPGSESRPFSLRCFIQKTSDIPRIRFDTLWRQMALGSLGVAPG